jgi:hypothetical protein
VHRHALDALIRLDATVPSETLIPHLRTKAAWLALILIAREPAKNRGILTDLFDRWAKDQEHLPIGAVAVGNLLAQVRAPGFAARLMARTPTRLVLRVMDPGHGGSGGRRSLRIGFGDGRADVPEGFPPHVIYRLVEGHGGTLLADGPHPVSWVRQEMEGRRVGFGGRTPRFERIECLNGWLAAMLGTRPEPVEIPATRSITIRFETPEAYVDEALAARDRILGRYWSVARDLVARKLLTLEEARGLTFGVEVEIVDERTDRSDALPALPPTAVRPELPDEVR